MSRRKTEGEKGPPNQKKTKQKQRRKGGGWTCGVRLASGLEM